MPVSQSEPRDEIMSESAQPEEVRQTAYVRPDGVTKAERYLKRLCDRTFLSLWSHASVYRDPTRGNLIGDGKELCDLLVVFENHIIIFSDKDCNYPTTDDPILNWLFLDQACTLRFPIALPSKDKIKFHRVIVAHGASRPCREENGGSGSLQIVPRIAGNMHHDPTAEFPPDWPFGVKPFVIGRVDPGKGYIHVLDDTSLDIVLRSRDTIYDFVDYLTKKEAFIESGRLSMVNGEEDLLAYYLKDINAEQQHDFVVPTDGDLVIQDGTWDYFSNNDGRRAQLQADKISYI